MVGRVQRSPGNQQPVQDRGRLGVPDGDAGFGEHAHAVEPLGIEGHPGEVIRGQDRQLAPRLGQAAEQHLEMREHAPEDRTSRKLADQVANLVLDHFDVALEL
jgi:hypothetical protein